MMFRLCLTFPLALLAAAIAAGCDSSGQEPEVVIENLVAGTGAEAYPGSVVKVDQEGWIAGGDLFHSTAAAGRPDSLTLDPAKSLEGWVEGVVGMREGGQRRITVPPELAHGSDGNPKGCAESDSTCVIPPGSTLVFEVHLLDVVGAEAAR